MPLIEEIIKNEVKLLKDDLNKKYKELTDLSKLPTLFISDYFYSVRNEIDYEAERILEANGDENESLKDRVNQMRELMVNELNLNEKKLIEKAIELKNDSSIHLSIEHIKEYIFNLFDSDNDDSMKNVNLFELETNYIKIINEIETEIIRLKCKYLLNQTFLFFKTSQNDFGILVIFEDNYLDTNEINCLK